MHRRQGVKGFGWRARVVAFCLILALTPGCQFSAAQIYIPLAYGLTGTVHCLAHVPDAAGRGGGVRGGGAAGGRGLQ